GQLWYFWLMYAPRFLRTRHRMNTRAATAASVAAFALVTVAGCATVARDAQTAPMQAAGETDAASDAAPASAPKALMATSPDGTRIAYEVTGTGPALMLIHGGGQTRRSWNDMGYVDRLKDKFTVITLDRRGHGESGKPMT